ncbi:hypothetical protein [Ralstonia solanacearum]|uniref:Conserved hypothethical protein n=1 Tax=Ralstonia solanacearum (strain Po82) TaxID=1031711 RepID=F6GAI6_RALS8|nr:hypothetical protein [Ralstonia solanacearum]AEG71774.1 conserved hypothethical protein [Ralstonia solanacearum Po82]AMP71661.1 hypothetical protein UW163_19385 [Ralstonia solanacearum]AMP76411.1 hypothetical protein RALBFv3_19765 [Ralstonia solanacearum]AYB63074.1 hypothetical protein C2124_21595 [Ralstonia solanacearum]EUJ12353.1 hypothetical protein RSP673_21480 [Ralstonia solanacearum P673]
MGDDKDVWYGKQQNMLDAVVAKDDSLKHPPPVRISELTAEEPSRRQPQTRHKQQRDAEGQTEEDALKDQG